MKISDLTPRRQQIVRLVRQGLCDKEIAASLEISLQTTKNQLQSIYRKTGVSTRIGLLLHFYEWVESGMGTKDALQSGK